VTNLLTQDEQQEPKDDDDSGGVESDRGAVRVNGETTYKVPNAIA